MYKICLLLFLVTFCSCNSQTNNKLESVIKISANFDSSAVKVTGIDAFILNELKSDSITEKDWQTNFSVFYKVEEDLQDLEKPIQGVYQLINEVIIFKPTNNFEKGKTYIVELYIQNPNTDITQQLKRGNSPFNNQIIKKEIQF